MKPYIHAKNSVAKWGGKIEDYLPMHDFLDSTKSAIADQRHRALLHNSYGIFILEQVFGHIIVNSSGKEVSVRDIGEQHVVEDLGFVPSVQDWLENMKLVPWMERSEKSYPSSIKSLVENGFELKNKPVTVEDISISEDTVPKKQNKKTYKEVFDDSEFIEDLKKLREKKEPEDDLRNLVLDGSNHRNLGGRRLDNLRID